MSVIFSILSSVALTLATGLVKSGIAKAFQELIVVRPDIRDKPGTRKWLQNRLGWIAYLQKFFLADMRTIIFIVATLREIVDTDSRWDALYDAIIYDAKIDTDLMPVESDTFADNTTQLNGFEKFCLALRDDYSSTDAEIFGDSNEPITQDEKDVAKQYVLIALNLLDSSASAQTAERLYSTVTTK